MTRWRRIDPFRLELPREGGMRVPGRIYADAVLEAILEKDNAATQVRNVAHLPGIVSASLAMPDIHWGYGFPIGGVAAFDYDEGVVSPGGVGYDINCGVRLAASALDVQDLEGRDIERIADSLFATIPAGLGRGGEVRLTTANLRRVLAEGAAWAAREGYGDAGDLERLESEGCLPGANPDEVSDTALKRGKGQLGTLGSGNHFCEVGVVDEVFDRQAADAFGLRRGQLTFMVHSGSRGLGHQVCDDFLSVMARYVQKNKLELPDRQLACAHVTSAAGQRYLGAMAAAANFAFANRHVLMALVERALLAALAVAPREVQMRTIYDVAHNIAKIEKHEVDGKQRRLVVHRKGATRAYPAGHRDVPSRYRSVGQPVLVPGDMGRESWVLVGEPAAMAETFGSACHGAGRLLSRTAATKQAKNRLIDEELAADGIIVRAQKRKTLAEEMPAAYKDVASVVDVVEGAGLARKVARLKPLVVIKG
ncbi:MAG: RtcB family protein [Candidatus Lernaella stagnicola]|nr:RtcB family protein [Candidatus Lernaella stagnicola]